MNWKKGEEAALMENCCLIDGSVEDHEKEKEEDGEYEKHEYI